MATQGHASRSGQFSTRTLIYGVLAALILVPLAAFGLGPLTSDSFSLEGPAGPLLAFSAGVLSFVSPCVLPIVPIYITQISGGSIQGGRISVNRRVTFTHAVAFVSGLTFIFIILGTSAGLLGSYFFQDNREELQKVAGVLLMLMGVVLIPPRGRASPMRAAWLLLGLTAVFFFTAEVAELRGDRPGLALLGGVLLAAWLRFAGYLQLPFLLRTFTADVGHHREVSYGRSALVGGAFALGWTPCIGPILGSILTLAGQSSNAWTGAYLLVAYSAGFSIPFLVTGLMLSDSQKFFRRIAPYSGIIEVASAVMLLSVGVLLYYGRLTGLNSFFGFSDFNQGL